MPLIGRAQICGGPLVRQVREKESISGAGKKMKKPSLLVPFLSNVLLSDRRLGGGERGRTCANGQELIHTYKEANNTDKRSKHIFNSLRTT